MRLRPLTDRVPKPLVPLHGKPTLQHLLESYVKRGFRQFVICTGYRGDMIRQFVSGLPLGASIDFSEAGESASILQRLHAARQFMGERAFVAYGDTLIHVDLDGMLRDHVASGAVITISTAAVRSPFGLVTLADDRWIASFDEKPLQLFYVGHMLLNRAVLDGLDPELLSLPDGEGLVRLFRGLLAARRLRMFAYSGPQITFNTPLELQQAERNAIAFFTQQEETRCP
ncbi:MAG: hypothetical protein A3D28_01595 [Omnitrophica bacterium RIFCSPHIGHO2_02_FULL_63_14]|nr:MAG: hypothetical protein A3D28_01595 [Omnitrophica bacterium RIFCSPHIGHO2_02_FULL_63_14]